MNTEALVITLAAIATCRAAMAAEEQANWWNPKWRYRTTATRPTPCRDRRPRPVEVALDFPLLLERGGEGTFDPDSVRVVSRGVEVPCVYRIEHDPRRRCEQGYVTWTAHPEIGQTGAYDIYFETKGRGIRAPEYDGDVLPPANMLRNPGFEETTNGRPAQWQISQPKLVSLSRFEHTSGAKSLKITVDENTPEEVPREIAISEKLDVGKFAGQKMLFECDLMAERAKYGAPVCIELQQFRANGSRILEYAIQPRWLTLELAEGQLVQFCERGQFSPDAATLNVSIRARCRVRDADTGSTVTGPESCFTVWLDRVLVRPGERWPWPGRSHAGFVEGALPGAPLNRGFEFTGQRRLVFNGGSEGTLTAGRYNPDPKSPHWGLQAGTLELWCKPSWNADDSGDRTLFEAKAYGHRLQSRLRKLSAGGDHQLEFTIADAGCKYHTVRGPAPLKAGQWHHISATWDFPNAHLQLFVDGRRVGALGPSDKPWPSSLVAEGAEKKGRGMGIMDKDTRSLPMQAFIGGDARWRSDRSAKAVIDEFRVSDTVRYTADFEPTRVELKADEHTRTLFHFENELDGSHGGDDQFVRGHLACELPPHEERAVLETLIDGEIERSTVTVKPHPSDEEFERNRAESRMMVLRPFEELPDPRCVEYRPRQTERIITGKDDDFTIEVAGDFPPLMQSLTYEHAEPVSSTTTSLIHWRANDNVVPFSVDSIRKTLAPNAANDAEKAFETFKYTLETTNYFDAHYCETLPNGRHRPRVAYTLLKALNIYPFDQCGPMNHMLRKLFLAAGISSNNASGTHHQFEQAFYDGDLRLFDLSSRVYWLDRDNATVLSRRGLEQDPYLKLRQGGDANAWLRGRVCQATYGTAERPHNMDFPLRPGERVSFCWHNEGRWFEVTGNREPVLLAKIPPFFGNGAILYEPIAKSDAAVLENLVIEASGDGPATLRALDAAKAASLTYRAACPYILSDAQVSAKYLSAAGSPIKLLLSFDEGKKWQEVWRSTDATGTMRAPLLQYVTCRYAYWLKVDLPPGAGTRVTSLTVRTTFVASPLALPGTLSLGENRISFVGGPPTAPIKTACRWVERHKTDLGISLNAISYYMNSGQAHRNVFVAAPDGETRIDVTLHGRPAKGTLSLEGLSAGWTEPSEAQKISTDGGRATATFTVQPSSAAPGDILGFNILMREREAERRVPAQLLVAETPLVREAEAADEVTGAAVVLPEASAGNVVAFTGSGRLVFDLNAGSEGEYALWLRARWEPKSSTRMKLTLDAAEPRGLSAAAMIGFTDWSSPKRAHAKMFAHFGEQYAHWSWYRIPDVALTQGPHRLALEAGAGAHFDALLLLPQNPVIDRAAMNLFQNWNYAPWDSPM